jgi:hypothetical protein
MMDRLSCPYSAPAFERFAGKRRSSRGGYTAFMWLGWGMAAVLFIAACALLTVLARSYYLETYGIAANATVVAMTFVWTNSALEATRCFWLPPVMFVFSKMDGRPSMRVSLMTRNIPPTGPIFLLPVSTSTSPLVTPACQ